LQRWLFSRFVNACLRGMLLDQVPYEIVSERALDQTSIKIIKERFQTISVETLRALAS
jgi:hypothetical protein